MTVASRAQILLDDPALRHLLAVIDAEGAETRVVGGAVRNALMGLPVNDIDCATTIIPLEVARLAQAAGLRVIPTGIDHGTVTVLIGERAFEITTLRRDVATDGRHAEVAFGRDFNEDAQRRDFTINALYLDKHGKLYDFTGGLTDISNGRVRFIGNARSRIREDYLRILRFFRFAADYGKGPLDAKGLSACIQERMGLTRLSRERIRAEMLRILVARRAIEIITVLSDTGLLSIITAGVAWLGRFARTAGRTEDAFIRLLGLAVVTHEDASHLQDRLRLSNHEYTRLARASILMSHLHCHHEEIDERALRCLVVQHGLQPVTDAMAVLQNEEMPVISSAALALLTEYNEGNRSIPVFPLQGRNLVQAGITSGPRMGRVLAVARNLWLKADCPTDPELLNALMMEAISREP